MNIDLLLFDIQNYGFVKLDDQLLNKLLNISMSQ